VPKARILEAVTEAKGEAQAKLIAHLKKGDMAKEAERMLAGARWLPEPLRTPEDGTPPPARAADEDPAAWVEEAVADLPDFLADNGAE
jgi:ParB family chromosome partitioning protein